MPFPHHNSQAWHDRQESYARAELRARSDRADLDALQQIALERKEKEAKETKPEPLP